MATISFEEWKKATGGAGSGAIGSTKPKKQKANADDYSVSNPIITATETKKDKPQKSKENLPTAVQIMAFGAGDYGAGKDTRVDKVLKGASQSTASSLVNTLGTLSGGTGELTMGESIQAAVKGQKQQTLETEKKQKQNAATKQKLYDKADALSEKSEKNISEAKAGLGKFGQTLVDVGVAGTQMLGDAALNIAVPGAGLVGMGLRSFGSGAQEQRQKGGTETDMLLGGLKSAAIEVLTEKIGGPFEKIYGKSFIGKTVNGAIDKLSKSGAMASVLKLFANGASEAAEEVISDILNPLADRLLDLDNKRGSGEKIGVFSEENITNMVHDGIVGGVLGLVGAGGQIVGNTIAKSNANAQTAQNEPQAVAGVEQQTTQDVAQNPITQPQTELNSALQNGQAQQPTNPIVAAIQNAQQSKPLTEERAAEITQTVQQAVDGAKAAGPNVTVQDILDDMQANPSDYGVTEAEITQYIGDGLGAANIGFTGEATPAERWVANAQYEGDDALHPVSDEQIANLAEQQGRAPTEVPKVDVKGTLTSKSVSTLVNSGVTTEDMANAIMDDAMNGKFSHIEYKDDAALSNANAKIEKIGWEQALGEYRKSVEDGKASKDITALGITLYNNAVTAGDYTAALDIVSLMTKNSTTMAQGLQAMRILNKLSPDSRLYMAVKSVENIGKEIKQKYNLDEDIEIDGELLGEYKEALDSGDKAAIREAWGNIEQNIADQIPSNWKDKLNAWRYLSMLGNPRTHIRNIVGNAGFAPVRAIKNTLAAGIESAVDKLGGDIERTKAVLNPTSETDRALIATAWADYANAYEAIMAGGKYNDMPNNINDRRTIFGIKPLESVREFNSNALNAEDSWFSQPAYSFALASYLKANGFSATDYADGTMSEADMTKAQEYAIKEAQKATYRDTNKFSKFITKLGKTKIGAVDMLVEGVLPFKKTPANILARAVEYSPVGIGIELAEVARGNRTAAEFIDGLSAGLTGTGILALGVWLAAQGLLSGGASDDDKQDAFDSLQGGQNYALNAFGKTYTLDWLAPEALPLFVGVELFNNMSGEGSWWDLFEAVGNISQPIFDMSMLQGVDDLVDTVGYANNPALAIATKAATNYISQFVPTLFGQVERTFFEDTRQSTFVDRNSETPTSVQTFLGKLANKTPGEYQQMDYIDAWGRTQSTGNMAQRAVNNFINPAYVSDKRTGEVETELQRLYDAGFDSVLPSRTGTDTKVSGEYLTKEQYTKYATTKGQKSLALVEQFMRSSAYDGMSDAAKADAIDDIYTYANNEAKLAIDRNADVPSWHKEAKESGNVAKYISERSEVSAASGGKTGLAGLAIAADNGASEEALVANMSDAQKERYATAKAGGASVGGFADAYNYYNNVAKGDNKKIDVINYINGLDESKDGKEALFRACYPNAKETVKWS